MSKPIPVTSPFMPPLDDFIPYLQSIWDSNRLTNGGPFHQQLEGALADYLGVKHLSLFANGTLALVTALQALRITGEVITTPYSFVATAHSLLWNGLKPIFVDIDPVTCNMNPERLEEAITPATTAILPVHCYGFPCDVKRIEEIADIYGLKVIYDAAHAFAVRANGASILQHGDLSILSFHATKVFNTFEGGAVICPDAKIKQRIDYFKNFGFVNETTVVAPGINGKMNEVEAAFGLLQLQHIDRALQARAQCYERYRRAFAGVAGLTLLGPPANIEWNHAYCPVLIEDGYPLSRDGLYEELKGAEILARRYFYPLITDFPMYRGLESAQPERLPNARAVAERVLCLPIYPDLDVQAQSEIIAIVKRSIDR